MYLVHEELWWREATAWTTSNSDIGVTYPVPPVQAEQSRATPCCAPRRQAAAAGT
jgi:hypothetical protein